MCLVQSGQKCPYASCLFFLEAMPDLAQGEFTGSSGVSAPLMLNPCPLPPSLYLGVYSLTTEWGEPPADPDRPGAPHHGTTHCWIGTWTGVLVPLPVPSF